MAVYISVTHCANQDGQLAFPAPCLLLCNFTVCSAFVFGYSVCGPDLAPPVPPSTCLLEQTVGRQGLTHFNPGLVGAHCVLACLKCKAVSYLRPLKWQDSRPASLPSQKPCSQLFCDALTWVFVQLVPGSRFESPRGRQCLVSCLLREVTSFMSHNARTRPK